MEANATFLAQAGPANGAITQGVPVPDLVETEVSTAEVPAAPTPQMGCQQITVEIQSLSLTLMVGVMWVQLPALRW